jgi:hypothetical protein
MVPTPTEILDDLRTDTRAGVVTTITIFSTNSSVLGIAHILEVGDESWTSRVPPELFARLRA